MSVFICFEHECGPDGAIAPSETQVFEPFGDLGSWTLSTNEHGISVCATNRHGVVRAFQPINVESLTSGVTKETVRLALIQLLDRAGGRAREGGHGVFSILVNHGGFVHVVELRETGQEISLWHAPKP